ncbi:IclR family transcriptional regulator [Microbaculum marinisediminis]|uniref:IclR family transcriptional regulator n=1 Tax=Microbaculum marinisediminis TaxID=2931392 RepID=A0AAW5R2A9_9HYPH|nr:IclR family transcriptional regulator [Microbaculum sp. A6E488]MCT8972983.1 IclR family transcriptional regulator [Microbaculum sp. A6E488]
MQTVDKAMKLLGAFTPAEPEIGLSDLARRAGYDKAATRRFLVALQKHGFIEQNPANRKYRLGAAFLHFAQLREATQPLASVIAPLLETLTEKTGETAHASHYSATGSGGALITIGMRESNKATRVHMDPSEILPLHATASGLVYLAFAPGARIDEAIAGGLKAYTAHTITSANRLRAAVAQARTAGHAVAGQSFEDEVTGIAMPFFDASGAAVGALAVATPSSRMTDTLKASILSELQRTVATATRGIGGVMNPDYLSALGDRRAA